MACRHARAKSVAEVADTRLLWLVTASGAVEQCGTDTYPSSITEVTCLDCERTVRVTSRHRGPKWALNAIERVAGVDR